MTYFRTTPTYTEPLVTGKNTSSSWYRHFQDIDKGIPPTSEVQIAVGPSPFIFTPAIKGTVLISGGTVIEIDYARTVGKFYNTGQTAGSIAMSANDQLKVTYSGLPTLIFMSS